MFWTIVVCLWQAQAQELMESSIDVISLLPEEAAEKDDLVLIEETLKRYAKASKSVVVGEIVTMRNVESNLGQDREAEVIVEEWLRGSGGIAHTIFIPYNAPYIQGEWETVPGKVVRGYSVLIFLDNQDRVLEGNAIFYFDGSYLWRNKRPGLFLNPNYDREWVDQNPYEDYIVIPVSRVQFWLREQRPAVWIRL